MLVCSKDCVVSLVVPGDIDVSSSAGVVVVVSAIAAFSTVVVDLLWTSKEIPMFTLPWIRIYKRTM